MVSKANVERIRRISHMYLQGGTMLDIAKSEGVTKERVRQLLNLHPKIEDIRDLVAQIRSTISINKISFDNALYENVRMATCETCGMAYYKRYATKVDTCDMCRRFQNAKLIYNQRQPKGNTKMKACENFHECGNHMFAASSRKRFCENCGSLRIMISYMKKNRITDKDKERLATWRKYMGLDQESVNGL